MRYRTLGRTGFQVSEIGLGGEYLEGQPLKQVCDTVDAAMDAGINLLDCFMSNPEIRSDLGTALKGKRDKMYIQGHFRSIWKTDSMAGRWTSRSCGNSLRISCGGCRRIISTSA